MNLQEKIERALKKHDEGVMAYDRTTPEAKQFIIKQVHNAVERLHELAKEIRANVELFDFKHSRIPGNILTNMTDWGQPLSSFLWVANLRDSVVDPIEQTYGVSFSGRRIYNAVKDKTDGKTVFVLYDPRSMRHGQNYTLSKDGDMFFVTLTEFDTNYVSQ